MANIFEDFEDSRAAFSFLFEDLGEFGLQFLHFGVITDCLVAVDKLDIFRRNKWSR